MHSDIDRGHNGEELSRIMSDWARDAQPRGLPLCAGGRRHWLCGPVLSPAEVMSGAMGLTDTFMRTIAYPGSDGIPVAGAPQDCHRGSTRDLTRPPLLGEHNDQVLAEFGFSPEEIGDLRGAGVI